LASTPTTEVVVEGEGGQQYVVEAVDKSPGDAAPVEEEREQESVGTGDAAGRKAPPDDLESSGEVSVYDSEESEASTCEKDVVSALKKK